MELPTSRLAQAQGEAVVFLGKVGVSVSRERLLSGQYEEYDGIFLALDDEDSFEGEILSLPETLCACVRFRGSHPQAPQQYRRLTQFIDENGLRVSDFSREITIIDYGITQDTEKFVTEIKIPVEK